MTTIVFMGSPDFSLPTLDVLSKAYDLVGVVTQPDRASGRGRELKATPVKTMALELGIPVMQPEKLRQPEAMEQLRAWNPDLIVVAAFGQILRREVLDLPRFGCINVHASLLPRWRGAAPINAAILHGDEETGVTIMRMDVGLDTGPMLSKRAIRLARDETASSAFEKLSLDFVPVEDIQVIAEYWVPESHVLAGRLTFTNHTTFPRHLDFELCGALSPLDGKPSVRPGSSKWYAS